MVDSVLTATRLISYLDTRTMDVPGAIKCLSQIRGCSRSSDMMGTHRRPDCRWALRPIVAYCDHIKVKRGCILLIVCEFLSYMELHTRRYGALSEPGCNR